MVLRSEKEGERKSSARRIAVALYFIQTNVAIRVNNRKVV